MVKREPSHGLTRRNSKRSQRRGAKSGLPPRGDFRRASISRREIERRLPSIDHRIFLSPEFQLEIRRNPSGSGIFGEIGEEELATRICSLVKGFMVRRRTAVPPNEFRRQLLKTAKALNDFLMNIAGPEIPMAYEIWLACRRELKQLRVSEIKQVIDSWPAVVNGELFFPGRGFIMDQVEMLFMRRGFTMDSFIHELGIWQQGINKLAVSETGPGRDSDRSAYWLIARLADLFELCTGKEAGRTYDGSRVGDEAVSGPFGIFVRAVNKQIPKDFRLRGIDNLICLFVSARKLSRSTARTR